MITDEELIQIEQRANLVKQDHGKLTLKVETMKVVQTL